LFRLLILLGWWLVLWLLLGLRLRRRRRLLR
jgi:hypothetical protein